MTVTNLPAFSIVQLAISDEKEDIVERNALLEDFLLSRFDKMRELPESFRMGDLAEYCFGNQVLRNYISVRNFIKQTQKTLSLANKDLLSTNFALVFNEGLEVKEACKKIHPYYRSGGAYLFTRKLLFVLLLTKSVEFRMFLRSLVTLEGKQIYDVPHELNRKHSRVSAVMVAM